MFGNGPTYLKMDSCRLVRLTENERNTLSFNFSILFRMDSDMGVQHARDTIKSISEKIIANYKTTRQGAFDDNIRFAPYYLFWAFPDSNLVECYRVSNDFSFSVSFEGYKQMS